MHQHAKCQRNRAMRMRDWVIDDLANFRRRFVTLWPLPLTSWPSMFVNTSGVTWSNQGPMRSEIEQSRLSYSDIKIWNLRANPDVGIPVRWIWITVKRPSRIQKFKEIEQSLAVPECFKDDNASQWKSEKFDPRSLRNPWTDRHLNSHGWLCHTHMRNFIKIRLPPSPSKYAKMRINWLG